MLGNAWVLFHTLPVPRLQFALFVQVLWTQKPYYPLLNFARLVNRFWERFFEGVLTADNVHCLGVIFKINSIC